MKNLRGAILLLCLVANAQSQAREFYKSYFQVDIVYANIDSGSMNLVEEQEAMIRYSDDHEFCQVLIGDEEYPCDTFHDDQNPEFAAVTLDREVAGEFLYDVIEAHTRVNQHVNGSRCSHRCKKKCKRPSQPSHPDYLAKFSRLATYLLDPINLKTNMSFEQQLHDREPESFRIFLSELSQGVQY